MFPDMQVRIGGDPRGFAEFTALCNELAKLGHPACPPMDWLEVERLCLALFRKNGLELQGAVAFTVACGQLYGPDGLVQGLSLIEVLVGQWCHGWPASESARLEVLAWLFAQLRGQLRSLESGLQALPTLERLDQVMASLDRQLASRLQGPFAPLHALREQLGNRVRRLPGKSVVDEMAVGLPPTCMGQSPFLRPMIIVVPPPTREEIRRKGRLVPWMWMTVAVVVACTMGSGWWLASQGMSSPMGISRHREPVRLNSLSLFEAGRVEFGPDSTRLLIDALANIKAQPGWLVVISGHTDATGDAEHNQRLSHARARAVRDWMQRMGGIPDSCFAVHGLAASQPIANNDSEAGRAANRRVDIHLMPQARACG